jgi:sarcosine oxidase delta subunit
MDRPNDLDALDAQLFVRTNPAGETRDLWYHENGCGAWMTLTRNTVTHAISGAELVMDRGAGTRVSARTVDAKPQTAKTQTAKPQTPKTQKGA